MKLFTRGAFAIALFLSLFFLAWEGKSVIVNNSAAAPTSEDSLSFIIYALDSLGNATTADSLFVLVVNPDGVIVYKDSLPISDSRITATSIRGKQFYTFCEQVSVLDGGGIEGNYAVTFLMKNNTQALLTPNTFSFQIISEELSDRLAMISDSVYAKGGVIDSNRTEMGGSGDSASIARWVWNTPQSNHTVAGTFGKFLDAEISGIGSGTGAYSFTLVTYDSATSQVIPQVGVAVRNLAQTALLASGRTDNDGTVAFNLDADSYLVVAAASGYDFAPSDTIEVTGAGTDTLFGSRFAPGNPSLTGLCRVYGFLYNISGIPEPEALVTAQLPSGVVRFSSVIVSPFSVSTTTDSNGYFFFDLIPSDSLIPAGTPYEFTISRTDGTILRQRLTVPDTTQWRLTW